MHQRLHAMIWDMGGVLLRTEDQEPRTQLAKRYGLSYPEIDHLVFGNPAAQLSESGRIAPNERWGFIGRKLNLSPADLEDFQTQFWAGDRLDEALVNLITTQHPHLKTGLLSNAGSDASQNIRKRFPKLLEPFDEIVFSGEVGLVKPDPAIYHLILNRLAVEPNQAVFIDDNRSNILTARMIGLQTVWFRSAAQARQELLELLQV